MFVVIGLRIADIHMADLPAESADDYQGGKIAHHRIIAGSKSENRYGSSSAGSEIHFG
jgi:hypothetical protein